MPGHPEIRAIGSVAGNITAITPGLPTPSEPGDLLLMICESGGPTTETGATTPITAEGWSAIPFGLGEQVKGNTRLTILWRISTGEDPHTTNDTGDHQIGRIIAIKKDTFANLASGEWINGLNKGTQAPTKAVSIPGLTTQVDNCLILACASGNLPNVTGTEEFSAVANGSLISLTERIDNTRAVGDGGALFVAAGVKEKAGTCSATTCTAATEAERAVISIGLRPPSEPAGFLEMF